jgi:hypothetical protein
LKVNTRNAKMVAVKLLPPTNAVANTRPVLVLTANTKVSNTQSVLFQPPMNANHASVNQTAPLNALTTENQNIAQPKSLVTNSPNEKNSSTPPNVAVLTSVFHSIVQLMKNVKKS